MIRFGIFWHFINGDTLINFANDRHQYALSLQTNIQSLLLESLLDSEGGTELVHKILFWPDYITSIWYENDIPEAEYYRQQIIKSINKINNKINGKKVRVNVQAFIADLERKNHYRRFR